MTADRGTSLRAAMQSRPPEMATAVLLAVGVAVLAILTTVAPDGDWDHRIAVAAHSVVVDATLRVFAVAVTTMGSPLVVNALR